MKKQVESPHSWLVPELRLDLEFLRLQNHFFVTYAASEEDFLE